MSLPAKWLTLNTLDFVLTWIALSLWATEGNLIIKYVGADNPLDLFVYKVVITLCVLVLCEKIKSPQILNLASIGLIIICAWNLFVIWLHTLVWMMNN